MGVHSETAMKSDTPSTTAEAHLTSENGKTTAPFRAPEGATPMMAQYLEIKAANADSLLFYRMGDFYEMFFEDASVASRALGIALTKRGKHLGEDIPMCGVPVHAADDYLQKPFTMPALRKIMVAQLVEAEHESITRDAANDAGA